MDFPGFEEASATSALTLVANHAHVDGYHPSSCFLFFKMYNCFLRYCWRCFITSDLSSARTLEPIALNGHLVGNLSFFLLVFHENPSGTGLPNGHAFFALGRFVVRHLCPFWTVDGVLMKR